MAYMFLTCHCIGCKKIISCNPDYVPSLVIKGQKEPLCIGCFNQWNQIHRVSKGLEPISIHPEAYEPLEVA